MMKSKFNFSNQFVSCNLFLKYLFTKIYLHESVSGSWQAQPRRASLLPTIRRSDSCASFSVGPAGPPASSMRARSSALGRFPFCDAATRSSARDLCYLPATLVKRWFLPSCDFFSLCHQVD
jgi:hypothetical protein